MAAGMLALALGACDSGNVAEVEQGRQSEELKAFLDSPPKTVVPGAHRQPDPHASLGADKILQVALQHLDEGRVELALQTLNQAIGKYPGDGLLLSVRASIFLQQQQASLALEDFNRCIELQPDVPAAWFNRASTYEALGRRAEAIGDLQRFLELEPDENWASVARDLLAQWDPEQS